MKRLMICILMMSIAGAFLCGQALAATAASGDTQFFRAKAGLLMSPGVIALIRTEGEIALDDERITCHRVRKTGSHMRETYCLTVEEAEIARTRNQTTMWRFLQGVAR